LEKILPKWTINDHNTQWWITAFTNNNIGSTLSGTTFPLSYNSDKNVRPFLALNILIQIHLISQFHWLQTTNIMEPIQN
jgi:hypothetical protein